MNLPLPTLKFAIIVSSVALGIGITAPTITITQIRATGIRIFQPKFMNWS